MTNIDRFIIDRLPIGALCFALGLVVAGYVRDPLFLGLAVTVAVSPSIIADMSAAWSMRVAHQ